MAKPRLYGKQSPYIPNARADMRRHKKVYQRGREKVFREIRPEKAAGQTGREETR